MDESMQTQEGRQSDGSSAARKQSERAKGPKERASARAVFVFGVGLIAHVFAAGAIAVAQAPDSDAPGDVAGEPDAIAPEAAPDTPEEPGAFEEGVLDASEDDESQGASRDTDIAPLNFCALAPKQGTGAYQRQRVVMLDVAEHQSLEGGPEVELVKRGDETVEVSRGTFRGIRPFEHAREVLLSVFPTKRLYLVLAPETPSAVFAKKAPIDAVRAQQLLSSDSHVAYSVSCADWLVAPYLSRGKVVWSKVTRKKTVVDKNGKSKQVSYTAWNVSVPLRVRLEVYRRRGERFVHHATLHGTPSGTAADEALNWNDRHDVHETVSVGMPSGCAIPSGTQAQSPGAFEACGGTWPDLSPQDASPTLGGGMRGRRYCQGLDDAASPQTMKAVALCELRVAAEYATVDLQLHGKQMCGWRLFSPLLEVPGSGERGVSMGDHEGAERGDYYIAYANTAADDCGDEGGADEFGFGRIYRLGPGGEAGFARPSVVHFQAGDPPAGVRMEEFALHGLRFALRPTTALLLANGDLESTFAFGAAFQFGYDLTRFIPLFDELWLEANAALLFASETYFPLGVGFEGAGYIAHRLSLIAGLGFALTAASTKVDGAGGQGVTLSGGVAGAQGRLGFNYALRPNWHVRLMAEVRSGFGSAKLDNEKELPGVTVDGGPLLMSMLALSLSYTF